MYALGGRATEREAGECMCEYLWHVRTNCYTYFKEGRTGRGRLGIIYNGGRWWGEEKKKIMCIPIMHVLFVVFVRYMC